MNSQEQPSRGAQLPPKPDPETGRPRPPRAPVDNGSGGGSGSSEQDNRHKPTPPPGQGPTLEWFKASRRRSIAAGIGGSIVVLVGITLFGGIGSLSIWWMWLIILIAGLLIGSSIRVSSCAAGAEWFAVGSNWVDLYNLSSIKVKAPTHYREIILKDRSDRQADFELMEIQENQDLWDLVYNGILHSVVEGGAETNKLGHSVLKLPNQPHDHPTNRHDP